MTSDGEAALPDPPDAPDIERRVSMHRSQWVLVPLMLVLPVLALFGVFGESYDRTTAAAGPIDIDVRYPSVLRYKVLDHIELYIRNRSNAPLDTVIVSIDTLYVRQFSDVVATPPFDEKFEAPVVDIQPNESRLVRIQLKAERYWRHHGTLSVAAGKDTARARLSTIIFP